jgi:DNA-binding MarR family transcriptional regulator
MSNADVTIHPQQAIILRAMLANPKKSQYAKNFAEELGMPQPTVRHTLYRLEEIGWLASTVEPRTGRYAARRFFNFTPAGLRAARAEIAGWNFTDE